MEPEYGDIVIFPLEILTQVELSDPFYTKIRRILETNISDRGTLYKDVPSMNIEFNTSCRFKICKCNICEGEDKAIEIFISNELLSKIKDSLKPDVLSDDLMNSNSGTWVSLEKPHEEILTMFPVHAEDLQFNTRTSKVSCICNLFLSQDHDNKYYLNAILVGKWIAEKARINYMH